MTPSRLSLALVGLAVLAVAAVPFAFDNYVVRLATFLCMYTALALSWNFIGGFTGYPSFSTAAFFGLGCYASALTQNAGVPMVAAWLLAGAVVSVFAAVLGHGILRMKGHYFAIGSISIVEILRLVASSWGSLTGGGDGLNVPILPGGPDFAGRVFLYAMLSVAAAAFLTTLAVARSRLGFGMRCIHQNEDAAEMVGIDTRLYKTAAYVLSSVFCGIVGGIYASWVAYIDPTDVFSILMTLKVPVMVLLGGAGTVLGPLIGSAAFVAMEEFVWANFLEYNRAILGIVIVLLIFFLPGGLLKIDFRRLRRRPAAAPAAARDGAGS